MNIRSKVAGAFGTLFALLWGFILVLLVLFEVIFYLALLVAVFGGAWFILKEFGVLAATLPVAF
jgi:hypothetical protein